MSVLAVPPHAGARLRLLCLPYAGGGAVLFSGWASRLPSFVQVCPVRLAGRESRLKTTPCRSLAPIVAEVADALAPHLDLPVAVYGHSMGGLIAFELSRELRRRRLPTPRHLFIAACRPPHRRQVEPPLSELPDAELFAAVGARYGALDPAILDFPDVLRLLLPTLRADLAAVEAYRFAEEPPLDCDLTLFGATGDRSVEPDVIAEWRRHVSGRVVLRTVDGGHRFVAEGGAEPVATLAASLAGHAVSAAPAPVAPLA